MSLAQYYYPNCKSYSFRLSPIRAPILRGIYFVIQSGLVEGTLGLKPHLNFNSSVTLGKFTVRAIVFLFVKCCLRYWDCLLIKSVAPLLPIQSPCEESIWTGSFLAQFCRSQGFNLRSLFLLLPLSILSLVAFFP